MFGRWKRHFWTLSLKERNAINILSRKEQDFSRPDASGAQRFFCFFFVLFVCCRHMEVNWISPCHKKCSLVITNLINSDLVFGNFFENLTLKSFDFLRRQHVGFRNKRYQVDSSLQSLYSGYAKFVRNC